MKYPSKSVIVTGAGSGIGRAFSLELLKEGYSVALCGRTSSKLQETASMSVNPQLSLVVPTNISDPESVKNLFQIVKTRFGRLDLLFNNAGINITGSLENIKYKDWISVISTNLNGAFLCTKEAFLLMKSQNPQGGRIINNGSISASVPRPDSAPYNASKHGITGLTKSTSLEGRKYNIACGQIDIGNVSTDMTTKMSRGVPQADGTIKTEPTMHLDNVTKALMYMSQLPLDANVQFMTVMATHMPFIGRG